MDLGNKVALITGGAHGIGRALAERFKSEGASVAVADLDVAVAEEVAAGIDGLAVRCDVTQEDDIRAAVAATEERFGPIDLMISNAGTGFSDAPGWTATSQTNEQWEAIWKINVMGHVWSTRAVLPGMVERGGGTILYTASAAGLLNQIGDASYATTKHASVAFAESVSITHGDQGIHVAVLCPQGVATRLVEDTSSPAIQAALVDGAISTEELADATLRGLEEGSFLILPHPKVSEYMMHKVTDYDRWLHGMRRFRRKLFPDDGIMKWDS